MLFGVAYTTSTPALAIMVFAGCGLAMFGVFLYAIGYLNMERLGVRQDIGLAQSLTYISGILTGLLALLPIIVFIFGYNFGQMLFDYGRNDLVLSFEMLFLPIWGAITVYTELGAIDAPRRMRIAILSAIIIVANFAIVVVYYLMNSFQELFRLLGTAGLVLGIVYLIGLYMVRAQQ